MTIIHTEVRSNFSYSSHYLDRFPSRIAWQTRSSIVTALEDPRDRPLKYRLLTCNYEKEEWCDLPACPVCVERQQRSLIRATSKWLSSFLDEGKLPISWIEADLPDQRYRFRDLCKINLPALNRQIRSAYQQAGFLATFSGINILFVDNECTNTNSWKAVVSSVIVGHPHRDVMRVIRSMYPRQPSEPWRPSLYPWLDLNASEALESTIKPAFYREVTCKRHDGSTDTSIHRIWGRHLRPLAHHFAGSTMPSRYVLTGCRLTEDGIKPNRGVNQRLRHLAARHSRHSDRGTS